MEYNPHKVTEPLRTIANAALSVGRVVTAAISSPKTAQRLIDEELEQQEGQAKEGIEIAQRINDSDMLLHQEKLFYYIRLKSLLRTIENTPLEWSTVQRYKNIVSDMPTAIDIHDLWLGEEDILTIKRLDEITYDQGTDG